MRHSDKILQYDVLRLIATLLVVIGHARYYVMQTGYGGCDYSAFVDSELFSWKAVTMITVFLNMFHMQIFMALGGALFYVSMQRGRYTSLGQLAADKAKRLLIPFVVVGVSYVFPMKLMSGYYSESDGIVRDLVIGQLLIQGNTHLWYLPAMFVDFLICYLLERYVKVPKLLKLGALAVLSYALWDHPIHLIAYPFRFAVWFYVGYCFEQVRPALDRRGKLWHGVVGCVMVCALFLLARSYLVGGRSLAAIRYLCDKWLIPVLAGLSLYLLSYGLAKSRWICTKSYQVVSRNTFGIYLYSDPVNYLILSIAARYGTSFLFGDPVGVIVLYCLRIVLSFGIALLISMGLRRYKVKYIA